MPLGSFRPVSTIRFSPRGLMYQTWPGCGGIRQQGIGHIDASVMADDDVVAVKTVGNRRRFAGGVVDEDLVGALGDRVQTAVRPEGLSIARLRVGDEQAHLAVETDLVRLAVGNVVEEDFALGVGGRTFGELVALARRAVQSSPGIRIS